MGFGRDTRRARTQNHLELLSLQLTWYPKFEVHKQWPAHLFSAPTAFGQPLVMPESSSRRAALVLVSRRYSRLRRPSRLYSRAHRAKSTMRRSRKADMIPWTSWTGPVSRYRTQCDKGGAHGPVLGQNPRKILPPNSICSMLSFPSCAIKQMGPNNNATLCSSGCPACATEGI